MSHVSNSQSHNQSQYDSNGGDQGDLGATGSTRSADESPREPTESAGPMSREHLPYTHSRQSSRDRDNTVDKFGPAAAVGSLASVLNINKQSSVGNGDLQTRLLDEHQLSDV